MAEYSIYFKESVEKELKAIPKQDIKKVLNRIATLAIEPRPMGCEKLTGQERYRLRQGRYRIVYSIQDKELVISVVKVGHRRDVYR
jgi:mRNA interferase RelE/StbE